jgi:hypothetical protein
VKFTFCAARDEGADGREPPARLETKSSYIPVNVVGETAFTLDSRVLLPLSSAHMLLLG